MSTSRLGSHMPFWFKEFIPDVPRASFLADITAAASARGNRGDTLMHEADLTRETAEAIAVGSLFES